MELKRHNQNPILKPIKENKWESGAVFNCGAIYEGGSVSLLYRAIGEYKNYISRLGYATSKDGVNFKRNDKPVFEPLEEYEKWGCEDPRITKIGDKFYITYVAHNKPATKSGPTRTALASTTDFIHFKRHGIITPKGADDRDVVLFPEKINGKYVMLHRPYSWTKKKVFEKDGKLHLKVKRKIMEWPIKEVPNYFPEKPSIWIAYSDNLKDWFGHKVLIEPNSRGLMKIGAGAPPLKTKDGWLVLYHDVKRIVKDPKYKSWRGKVRICEYRVRAALLDLKDPSKIIANPAQSILLPKEDYELDGDVPLVVFLEGAIIKGDELFVYYGAADTTCCLATCKLNELMDFLLKKSSNLNDPG